MLPTRLKGALACVDRTNRPRTCSATCLRRSGVGQESPLRAMRRMTGTTCSGNCTPLYEDVSDLGRPSIPPEQLRALLLQGLYTDSQRAAPDGGNRLQRLVWLVHPTALSIRDEPIWSPTTFSKNQRYRLLTADVASAFFDAVGRPGARGWPDVRQSISHVERDRAPRRGRV